jgi:hypothetical protein
VGVINGGTYVYSFLINAQESPPCTMHCSIRDNDLGHINASSLCYGFLKFGPHTAKIAIPRVQCDVEGEASFNFFGVGANKAGNAPATQL